MCVLVPAHVSLVRVVPISLHAPGCVRIRLSWIEQVLTDTKHKYGGEGTIRVRSQHLSFEQPGLRAQKEAISTWTTKGD